MAKNRQNWRKKTGEAMSQIWANVPHRRERHYQKSGIDLGTCLDKLNVSDLGTCLDKLNVSDLIR